MFILIGILILLIFGFMYIITIYFTTSNDYIPEITTMSEIERKKQLLYDNITNNELIDRVCKKIYDISGINGLEFVNTIIKSISIT